MSSFRSLPGEQDKVKAVSLGEFVERRELNIASGFDFVEVPFAQTGAGRDLFKRLPTTATMSPESDAEHGL